MPGACEVSIDPTESSLESEDGSVPIVTPGTASPRPWNIGSAIPLQTAWHILAADGDTSSSW